MGVIDPAAAENEAAFQRYDFFRCRSCQRLVTKLELEAWVPFGQTCPCSGMKFSPCNPVWYEFFLLRVIKFAFQRAKELWWDTPKETKEANHGS